MTTTKAEIEAVRIVAKKEGKSPVELLTLLQASCAKIGDEATLEKLCEIKSFFIDEMMSA
jgi:hypothetical protein